jgi:hypothetical protein
MNWKDYSTFLKALKANIIKIFFLMFLLLVTAKGQVNTDSVKVLRTKSDTLFVMTKSPWGAVGRSAVIPGWGQYYNEAYWKIPVVWGVLGWFTYLVIENNNLYSDYKKLYSESLENGGTGNTYYRNARDKYREERDKYILVLGISYILNLVDAYVDAQLFDFDVSENPVTRNPQLNIRVKF